MEDMTRIEAVLADIGPRLRRLRSQRGITLTALAAATGISKSTLSRLESGKRKPSLELLLPVAQFHQVPLEDLVGSTEIGDPRMRLRPRSRNGRLVFPSVAAARRARVEGGDPPRAGRAALRTHHGYEWLYVLSGHLRLILGEHDITMRPGEAAEFDTRTSALVRAGRRRAGGDPERARQSRQADAAAGLAPRRGPWSAEPARGRALVRVRALAPRASSLALGYCRPWRSSSRPHRRGRRFPGTATDLVAGGAGALMLAACTSTVDLTAKLRRTLSVASPASAHREPERGIAARGEPRIVNAARVLRAREGVTND